MRDQFIVVNVRRPESPRIFAKQDEMKGASNWADKVAGRVRNDQLLFKREKFRIDLYVPLLQKIVVMSRVIRRS